ncbi:hypothetical protein ABPG77_009732 [Micractinium sp. CCAP 211/92]
MYNRMTTSRPRYVLSGQHPAGFLASPLVRPASEAPPQAKKGKAGASTKAAPTSAATKAAKPATKHAAKPAASAGAARASAGSAHSRFGQAPQPRVQRGINAAKPLAGAAAPPAAGTHKRSSREAPTAAESVTTDETASALDLLALSQQPSQPGSPAVSAGVSSPATSRQPGSPAISAGVPSPAGIVAPAASICRLQHDAPFSEAQYKAAVQAAEPGTRVEDDFRLWKRVAIRPYLPAALPAADSDNNLTDL